jgi:hypothetical protein
VDANAVPVLLAEIPSRAQVVNNTSLVGTVTDANGAVMGAKAALGLVAEEEGLEPPLVSGR